MQPYELEAWLGDNHGLTDEQLATLLDAAGEIQERYPKPDDQEERDAALAVAYRILLGQDEVLEELAKQLAEARRSEEHTSELQSRENLVCRLLLEKKKKDKDENTTEATN